MAETEGIEIPEGYIEGFLNDTPEPGGGGMEPNPRREISLGLAENTLQIFFESFDEAAKDRGGTGLGKVPSRDLAKLSRLSLEDILPDHVLENSPHYALLATLTGIGAQNYVAIRRHNKSAKKEKTTEENE